jgi:hypothetical protein
MPSFSQAGIGKCARQPWVISCTIVGSMARRSSFTVA